MQALKRIRKRKGRCYELALKVMLDEPGADNFTLVHGRVRAPDDSSTGHAWIVDGGRVYDPVLDRYFDPAVYADTYRATGAVGYTKDEAARLAMEQGHYGPWH
jgi:hypothetical protein